MKSFPAFLTLLWCFLGPTLFAQSDSIIIDGTPIHACPGPIYQLPIQAIRIYHYDHPIDSMRFRRGDDHSIEYGLSTVPGLRFESRGPGGSRRVSLRGSLLRSGFGVRGIKAYINGIPLTSPDGNTPLEVIDVAALQNTQVEMGPQCAKYGAGTGGLIHFQTGDPAHLGRYGGTVSLGGGSFGYQRASIGLAATAKDPDKGGYSALYVRERFAGYRAQEGNFKDFVFLSGNKNINVNHRNLRLKGTAWYYDGGWELPGALDSTAKANDPRSANPISQNVTQAAVYRKWLQGNLHYTYSSKRHYVHGGIYGQWTHKLNPYGTSNAFKGYKDEAGSSWGTRTTFGYSSRSKIHYNLRVELQAEPARLKEYENASGMPGPLLIDQRVDAFQGLVSIGAHRSGANGSDWAVDASLNHLATRFQDMLDTQSRADIGTPLMPQARVSYGWDLNRLFNPEPKWNHLVTLSSATSYSPPSWWELRRPDGSIDDNLRPEQGVNAEASYKISPPRFTNEHAELRVYHHQLYRAILPYTLATGATEYRNAEVCGQTGAELSFHLQPLEDLVIEGSAAYMHYRFLAESPLSNFEKGDAVPGIPAYTGFLAAEYRLPFELRVRLSGHLTGPIWLDSRNTDRQPAFALLNAFLEQPLSRRQNGSGPKLYSLRLNFGCNNLLDVQYSNYLNLNDQSRRYWNPAPGRNIFAGLHFTF